SSVNPQRQKGPYAHSIVVSPDNRFALAADLGIDKVLIYQLDPKTAQLTPNISQASASLPPGSGPRHFAIHPNGKWAWIINEMALTLTGFAYDSDAGRLTEIQSISTVPDSDRDQKGLSTAEVQVHPSGNFVYGSNRGHHSIAVFRVNAESGQLTWVENAPIHGKTPRNFGIDPSGRWLLAAGQDSDTITVFSIDPSTGALTFTGQEIAVGTPVCVKFLPLP
ncbi:MAG: lactonase family protein, partial [Verrucomicrobiae bacterium]|nr:lactonase family protein [Verrucomicrobiae bacterium]